MEIYFIAEIHHYIKKQNSEANYQGGHFSWKPGKPGKVLENENILEFVLEFKYLEKLTGISRFGTGKPGIISHYHQKLKIIKSILIFRKLLATFIPLILDNLYYYTNKVAEYSL